MYRAGKFLTPLASGVALVLIAASSLLVIPQSACADSGAASIGGLIGRHVLTNVARRSDRRTQAAEYEAYHSQPATTQQAAPASQGSSQSVEQKLDTLDQLAAKGYITKEEYQKRRQAILDSL